MSRVTAACSVRKPIRVTTFLEPAQIVCEKACELGKTTGPSDRPDCPDRKVVGDRVGARLHRGRRAGDRGRLAILARGPRRAGPVARRCRAPLLRRRYPESTQVEVPG